MVREILFRGKRIDNGEWVEAFYFNSNTGKSYILTHADDSGNKLTRILWNEVIPSTVGEYTGLPDKNGTKIFEGDICKYEYFGNNRTGIVRYNKKVCCFEITWKSTDGHTNTYFLGHVGSIEIIGNIHESEVGE